jgi:Transmembrane domain of unknown function (DUF3566)
LRTLVGVSKTERALDEPGFDDASQDPFDPADFGAEFHGPVLTDHELDDEQRSVDGHESTNGVLPAPTVPSNGLAPPTTDTVDEGSAGSGNGAGHDAAYPLLDESSGLGPNGLPAPALDPSWHEGSTDAAESSFGPPDSDRSTDEATPAALKRDRVTEELVPGAVPGEALRVAPPGADILEELRRADIDGPTVDLAPQGDTASTVRRPHRLREYDPAPIPIPARVPRLLGRKPRVRKVTRVVRHVDPWSVFKIALVANLVLYVIGLVSGVLLWNVANATGTVDNVERFFESFGWSSFEFNGGQIYHSAWIAGLFLIIGLTGIAVLAATLFNLITDLVGGMRFTVLEEEVVETRTSPMRRFVVRRPEPEVPAIDHDESGPIIREAIVDDSGAIIRRSR